MMNHKISLFRLLRHLLKHSWVILLCAAIGFGGLFGYAECLFSNTYTASATLYINSNNPNIAAHAYINASDLSTAVLLLDTYMVVIESDKVIDAVTEQLRPDYPAITAQHVRDALSMGSVSDTGVLRIACTTRDAQLSAAMCASLVETAPAEIMRVVGAGSIQVIDSAAVPKQPNDPRSLYLGLLGGVVGAGAATGLLVLLLLMDRHVAEAAELTGSYTLPLLAELPMGGVPSALLLNEGTNSMTVEAYNRLRMNLRFALSGKRPVVLVSSAVPGEGRSTIAANLAITCARAGKKVLLIDADLRKPRQASLFFPAVDQSAQGLSELLSQTCGVEQAIMTGVCLNLDVMRAGTMPPNPAELLGSDRMKQLLDQLEQEQGYELIVLDMPPINVVSDPLVLADAGVSMLYVVRQGYSDHRELRSAFTAAELAGMKLLGMVLLGEQISAADRNKKQYYRRFDKQRKRAAR